MYGKWLHLALSFLTLLAAIATASMHLMAWSTDPALKALYANKRPDAWQLRDSTFLDVVWVQWMWVAVHILQFFFGIYACTAICRPHSQGKSIRHAVHPTGQLVYILGLLSVLAWSLFLDRLTRATHHFSGLALLGACVLIHVSCSIFVTKFGVVKGVLLSQSKFDVFLIRGFVFNGLAALATWLVALTFFQVAQVLAECTTLSIGVIQYMWLGAVTGYASVVFLVQVAGSTYGLEYTFTPYLVSILALASVLVNNAKQDGARISNVMLYVTIAMMAFMGLLFFAALGVTVEKGRRFEQPIRKRAYSASFKLTGEVVKVNNLSTDSEPMKYFDPLAN